MADLAHRIAWEQRRLEIALTVPELEALCGVEERAELHRWIVGASDWSDRLDRPRPVCSGDLLEERCLDEAFVMILPNPLLTGQQRENVAQLVGHFYPGYLT